MNHHQNYDAIVIGAGPCGCTAAQTLSKNGFKVLVLEKHKLPRYKSCSGVLIEKSLRFIERKFGCRAPASVTCAPAENRGMVFADDKGREYKFESRGLNVWRDKFDYWLLSFAREAGAEIKDECTVTSLRETDETVFVSVNGAVEQAKYVIDCSGAAGIGKKFKSMITYQTFNKGTIDLDDRYFYAYLQPELSGYDAWFNVKDGMLVLGVAGREPKTVKMYYDKFTAFMKSVHGLIIDKQLKTDKWLIRNIQPDFEIDYGSGRILKAGENAGFLNPMGEGVSCAMESGYCAASAVVSYYSEPRNIMQAYKDNVRETKDYMRRQWQLVGRMSDKFSFMCK